MYCLLLDVNLFDTLLEHQHIYRHRSVLSVVKTSLLIYSCGTASRIIYKCLILSALVSINYMWSLEPEHNTVSATFDDVDKGLAGNF